LTFAEDGSATALIARSKTDDEGVGGGPLAVAEVHLTICFPESGPDGQSESHRNSRMQFTRILGAVIPQVFDSMRYGNGIRPIFLSSNGRYNS
jgi:hypothetical protein